VSIFKHQISVFKEFLSAATPSETQQKDIDFLLGLGEIFALVVYGQLILENALIYSIDEDTVEQIFDFMVRDFSRHALNLFSKPSTTNAQMESCKRMIEKPQPDETRFLSVWESQVMALKGAYELQQ
jgi:acyl-CoA dehydrogenase